jgi:RecA-family ATPase
MTEPAKINADEDKTQATNGVYPTLDYFFNAQFDEPEEILFGVHRGEVASLFAVTNYGKTTLLYNTALSIAAGETILPLAPNVPKPRRVLYVDSETPPSISRADLQTMIRGISDSQTSRQNIAMVIDASFKDSPLNLSDPEHFNRLIRVAKGHKPDLVIIDTAASAFEVMEENSNAEITRKVMNPLKRLAREANCAVIYTHHVGKANETNSGEAAYKGRGASAFGALSRTIFTIEKDAKKGEGYSVLSCAKVKGQRFEPVLLKLNQQTRWFEIDDNGPSPKPKPLTAQEIATFVEKKTEARTAEICEHFKSRAGKRTIEERIRYAAGLNLIFKPNSKAPWRSNNGNRGHFDSDPEVVDDPIEEEFPQSATPIRECGNAETRSDDGFNSDSVGSSEKIVRYGPAIWRNTDHDQSVVVKADAGVGSDGRRYVWIEESTSAIPFDEIIYESPPDPTVDAIIENESETETING